MITIKSKREFAKMAIAGATVAAVHEAVREAAAPGVSLMALEEISARIISERGCTSSFLGYHGTYPATLCLSPNDVIVHGIPSERRLEEGDILSVDSGAIFEGFHGDAAFTMPIGAVSPEAQRLIDVTEEALWAGVRQVRKGGHLGDIGASVAAIGEANSYGVVEEYVGHGIGRQMHEEPQVPNYGKPGQGLRLRTGMSLCIEPMFNVGSRQTSVDADGWTVRTADGSLSAHWEHTVCLTPDGPQVFTAGEEPIPVEFEQSAAHR
ncbi:MAG TPA: type I methionyl aminopeptidase [Acidimicrobiia bacterium]|jgi:methionyl aminopeptidase|nr:type I methionyl aminopeptidase [Acidimicrobiia bacterium]HJS71744.1 type I methionyl aminopeptidase [Acidimicrobiia bacterium]